MNRSSGSFNLKNSPTSDKQSTSSSSAPLNNNNERKKNNDNNSVTTSFNNPVTCRHCELPITSGHAYELGEESRWHIDCFQCYKCDKKLTSESDFLVLSTGALVCYDCSEACTICGCKIDELAIILSNSDEAYCRNCFKCSKCDDKLNNLRYAKTKRGIYCISCHEKLIEKRKLAKLQNQIHHQSSSSSIRNVSAADSDISSDFGSNSRLSTFAELTDISKKAKEKVKKLPNIPSPELKKKNKDSDDRRNLSVKTKTPSLPSSLSPSFSPGPNDFNFRQPPELQSKNSRISTSDSSLNLSAHTTAENSPLIPQQGSFATKSYETLLKKQYTENMNKNNHYNNNNPFQEDDDEEEEEIINVEVEVNKDHSNDSTFVPMRSPKRQYNNLEKENIPDDFTLNTSSIQTPNEALRVAPVLETTTNNNNNESINSKPSQQAPPPRTQPLYHARTLSQQKNEVSSNPSFSSPTVLGNMSVKNTPTILQNGFSNANNSTSKSSGSARKTGNHSKKPSIDDVLASTLKNNQNTPENDLFLNKTPLKNNPVEEDFEIGEHKKNGINTNIFNTNTEEFIDNQSFYDDEDIQMALQMRNEISPQKGNTLMSSQDEYMTASNSKQDINRTYNESYSSDNHSYANSTIDTPRKLGRSLSLKSPKRFFQSLTKSPVIDLDTTNGRKNSSEVDLPTDSPSQNGDFFVPPLPTDILTSKQQQKIETQTGYSSRHRKTSSSGSISTSATNKMYSANPTMPLSEQTLMDGQKAKMKLNQMLKMAGKPYPNESKRIPSATSNHQRSISSSSALQRSIHSRAASLDYMNGNSSNNINRRDNFENDVTSGLGVKKTESDFERGSAEGFQFGGTTTTTSTPTSSSSNNNSNNELNETMLQLRKLKLEIYNMENTKKILANEVESLSNQKNKLLLELSELNINIKNLQSNNNNNNSNNNLHYNGNNSGNLSQQSFPEENHRKESVTSSITSGGSSTINNNDTNSNNTTTTSKPRFWKSIFQSNEKNHSSNKSIDKSSIKMSSSASQPLLNTLIGSHSTNNLSLFTSNMNKHASISEEQKDNSNSNTMPISELINIENKYNNVLQDDIDAFSKTTTISNDTTTIRDYSVIGFCKMEKHSGIPFIIRFFIDFMNNNESFMKQEGIYRKTASKTLIEQFELALYGKYKEFIEQSTITGMEYVKFYEMCSNIITTQKDDLFLDAHLLCSCFKRFLRRLLVPVIPFTNYFDLINDNSSKIILPKEHEQTLNLIINHLKQVIKYEVDNKMSKYNLALVFAPSLIRDLNNEREMLDFKERVKYIEYLLL
ncbi:hypothetical protein ACO0SA_001950 [Hanseniaspora valbyensis]